MGLYILLHAGNAFSISSAASGTERRLLVSERQRAHCPRAPNRDQQSRQANVPQFDLLQLLVGD